MKLISNATYKISSRFVVTQVEGISPLVFKTTVAKLSRKVMEGTLPFNIRSWKYWDGRGTTREAG